MDASAKKFLFEYNFSHHSSLIDHAVGSDEEFYSYIHSIPLWDKSKSVELACFAVIVGKLDYLSSIFDQEFNKNVLSKMTHLLGSLFSLNIFSLLSIYQPQQLPNLLSFQMKHFTPSLLGSSPDSFNSFSDDLQDPQLSFDNLSETFAYIISFLTFIHPNNFSNSPLAYTYLPSTQYCAMLSLLLLTSQFFDIEYRFAYLAQSLSEELQPIFYTYLVPTFGFFSSQSILIYKIPLSITFDNQVLASLAFKNNHEPLLQFCDIPKHIKNHPHLFI